MRHAEMFIFFKVTVALVAAAILSGCDRPKPSAADYVAQGVQHARDGKYRAALVKFSTALQVDPSSDLAYLYMASLFEDYLNDRSNAIATLQAYRAAANTEFSLRIATRLLYAAELEKLEQDRQHLQTLTGLQRGNNDTDACKHTEHTHAELLLARERIALLEWQIATLTSRLSSLQARLPEPHVVVTVTVSRAPHDADLSLMQRRLNEAEEALRRQTALTLHLEQRVIQLQQLLANELELRRQLEGLLPVVSSTGLYTSSILSTAGTPTADEIVHIVQPGDTLTALARRYYNNPDLWMRIYLRNRSTLPTPDTLRQGQILFIPR